MDSVPRQPMSSSTIFLLLINSRSRLALSNESLNSLTMMNLSRRQKLNNDLSVTLQNQIFCKLHSNKLFLEIYYRLKKIDVVLSVLSFQSRLHGLCGVETLYFILSKIKSGLTNYLIWSGRVWRSHVKAFIKGYFPSAAQLETRCWCWRFLILNISNLIFGDCRVGLALIILLLLKSLSIHQFDLPIWSC